MELDNTLSTLLFALDELEIQPFVSLWVFRPSVTYSYSGTLVLRLIYTSYSRDRFCIKLVHLIEYNNYFY